MLKQLRSRMTYANAMSTVAVFIALGGSSYAALTLPRNSVGANQIRTGAVHSSELRDRTIQLRDISFGARASLRGAVGPTGPAGAVGAPAVKFFATVDAAGNLVRGNATSGGHNGSAGNYIVGFAQPVSTCSFFAALGTADATTTVPGRVTVNDLGGKVGVQTFDASGAAVDLPFHVLVAC